MPLELIDTTGPILCAKISGELSKPEVTRIQTAAREAIKRCGKVSALFFLENFQGWKKESGWGDITFLTEHDQEILQVAVVGEEEWRDFVFAFLAKGFRQAQVEYYLPGDTAKARAWLSAP